MNYYTKYIKYKFKYLNLLNQIGGFHKEEIIKWEPKSLINCGAVCWMNAVCNFLLDIPELEHDKTEKTELIKDYIKINNQIAINNKTNKNNNLNFEAIIPIWCELVKNTTQYRTLTLPNGSKVDDKCNNNSHALLSIQVDSLEVLYEYLKHLNNALITIIKFDNSINMSNMNANNITTKYMFVYIPNLPENSDFSESEWKWFFEFKSGTPDFKKTYNNYTIKGWLHRRDANENGHYLYINTQNLFDDTSFADNNNQNELHTYKNSRCLLYEIDDKSQKATSSSSSLKPSSSTTSSFSLKPSTTSSSLRRLSTTTSSSLRRLSTTTSSSLRRLSTQSSSTTSSSSFYENALPYVINIFTGLIIFFTAIKILSYNKKFNKWLTDIFNKIMPKTQKGGSNEQNNDLIISINIIKNNLTTFFPNKNTHNNFILLSNNINSTNEIVDESDKQLYDKLNNIKNITETQYNDYIKKINSIIFPSLLIICSLIYGYSNENSRLNVLLLCILIMIITYLLSYESETIIHEIAYKEYDKSIIDIKQILDKSIL